MKKRRYLQSSIDELLKDADTLADKAEKKSDMLMLGRSNDLRRLSKVKKSEIDELDKMEKALVLRRQSVI